MPGLPFGKVGYREGEEVIINVIKHPRELKPHPINTEIYGMEVADLDFVENIRTNGIREPIVIKEDNTIMSGHRRWMAAKDLKLDTVACRIEKYSNDVEELEALLDYNRQREKSVSQKINEKHKYEWIGDEKKKALDRKREHANTAPGRKANTGVQMDTSDKGKSREKNSIRSRSKSRIFI